MRCRVFVRQEYRFCLFSTIFLLNFDTVFLQRGIFALIILFVVIVYDDSITFKYLFCHFLHDLFHNYIGIK